MLSPKELDPKECNFIIQNQIGIDNLELTQYSFNGFFSFIDELSFQVRIIKKQTPFIVAQLNSVQTGVFTYPANNFD